MAQVRKSLLLAACLTGLLLNTQTSRGNQAKVDYATDIQPVFNEHCVDCHGAQKQKSGLRLDSPEHLLRGGTSGEPALIAGNSAQSHIVKLVTGINPDEVMPPSGKKIPKESIQLLMAWIDQGAAMPELDQSSPSSLPSDHWSLQPVEPPTPPTAQHPFVSNPIDAFVLERLQAAGLQPSQTAERKTLIRRLYLVMHGLPPTPDEVEQFVSDTTPDAYERLVDRVLASPRYGERWARHWLDVVRYADSNGFETNRERKTAYPYRDYVIAAFNEDKPYNQFIREQLAGDTSGVDAATGFLVAGPYDIVKSPDMALTLMQRQNELDDMINTTGTAFLGLTVGCARCHNHKFDPIPQKDYYALQAVFAGVQHGERPLRRTLPPADTREIADLQRTLESHQSSLEHFQMLAASRAPAGTGDQKLPPVNPRLNEENFATVEARAVRFTIQSTTGSSEPCIDEIEVFNDQNQNVALASEGARPSASGTLPGYEFHKLEHINDGHYGNGRSWISNTPGGGWVQINFANPQSIHRITWSRDRDQAFNDRLPTRYLIEATTDLQHWTIVASSDNRLPPDGNANPDAFLTQLTPAEVREVVELRHQMETTESRLGELRGNQMVWAGTFSQPETTHRLYRGDPFAKREPVAPDALSVLGTLGMAMDEPEKQRRLKLAEWIASPHNPLTARVLVNRLWHYIFGTGIVATPSDFGANGVAPTHPELLDWLAGEFIQSGWSIKHIQRLILNSNTFRQSSFPDANGLARDASSTLLWRFPPRRLEAEAIRDSILAVSGALDLRMGGPGFYLLDVEVENVMHYFPKENFSPEEFRRMVYVFKVRQEQDAIFGSFDCPDGNQVIPQRSRSNTPLQALNLFNSPFVLQQADLLSQRLETESGHNPSRQVDLAFRLAYARKPAASEHDTSIQFIEDEGLRAFCRALYNTSEFIFVF